MRNTDPYPKQKIDEIDAILNPKPVVTDNKVEIDPEKLQPLGIPFKKTIIDAKDELKKAEIARQTARNNELNSGIQNVNDRANELGDKKHEEQLTTSKSVYYINSDIEKSFISNDAGHQDVIELNKKVTKELLDFEDNSNVLENSDHLNIQDKIDIMVQENSLEYDDKNIAFVGKGDVLKKHNTEYTDALVLESQKYNDKTVDTKQEILSTEHKILEKQIDDKESRIAVEKRIETTVDKTTQKNEDLNNNETDEILNSKIQLVSAEKKLGDKIENDMKNSNEISVDIASIKHKVQASVDEGNEHKTEESNNITNQIVDLNKKLANEALQQKDDLQNSTESLKNTNKTIQDNLNDEYNDEMVKYLASKNKIEGKVNKVYEDNTVSNEKLIDHNETIKDLATNLSDENGKQAQDKNEKLLSAQQSLHDSKTDNSTEKPIIANSIGKEYPEGVSQESFTQNDENGLMKAIITRRVVVVGGKGDVYVRTQTLSTITYSKNGSPSSERVWQKETQNPNLVKHY